MNTSRRRASFATFSGSAINLLVVSLQAIVLIPLYLKLIGPRLYGAWLGSGDILIWMQALDFGLPNLIIQRIGAAYGRDDLSAVGGYFASGVVTLGIIGLGLGLGGIALSYALPQWMRLEGSEAQTLQACFAIGSVAAALTVLTNSVVGFSRGVQNTVFMNALQVAASIIGFVISLVLIATGFGLWALAIGLLVRSITVFIGGVVFTARSMQAGLSRYFRVQRHIMREFLLISPATAAGGISYAIMNQSEAAIIAIVIRPELAAVYRLTRNAVDVARGLADTIGVATYGSYAHLITSNQRHRALQVHGEIRALRLSLAVVLASAYIAVNPSLLAVWVGTEQYGGAALTILMGFQFIFVGESYLLNYLYRATGPVLKGSAALVVESLIRVPLMIGLLRWLGLVGVPLAALVTSLLFAWLSYRWTLSEVASFANSYPRTPPRVWVARLLLLTIGAVICIAVQRESWLFVLGIGTAVTGIGGLILLYLDPLLEDIRTSMVAVIQRVKLSGANVKR